MIQLLFLSLSYFSLGFFPLVNSGLSWHFFLVKKNVFFKEMETSIGFCSLVICIHTDNYFFFKPATIFITITGPLVLLMLLVLIIKRFSNTARKVAYVSAALSIVFNFFLNFNFFPNLLKYQAGKELADLMEKNNIKIPDDQIMLIETNAHSFDFHRKYNHAIADNFSENY